MLYSLTIGEMKR